MIPRKKRAMQIPFVTYLLGTAAVFFVIIAFAISVLVSWQYSKTMWNRQLDNTLTSLSVATDQIGQLLNDAKTVAAAAQLDVDIDNYLFGSYTKDIDRVLARRAMLDSLTVSINKSAALQGLFFIKSDGSLHGYNTSWTFLTGEERHPFSQDEKLRQVGDGKGVTWIAPYQLADLTLSKTTKVSMDNTLVLGAIKSRYVLSYENEPNSLITLASVNIKSLRACFNYLNKAGDATYLVNENGECIVSTGTTWRQGVVDYWTCVEPGTTEGSRRWESSEGDALYVVYHAVPSTGWYLIKTTSASLYEQDLATLRRNVVWIALALLVVTTAFYMLWAKRITASLEGLKHAMERMRMGDLSLRIEEPMNIREYEVIREQFNHMANSIEQLIEETKEMERERVTLEARTLQTQLSPHMIFNSISAIRWMATALGVEQISSMLGALAELLRPVFREWRLSWTLREELAHLENYVVLLKLRCGDALELNMNIPGEMMDALLPCFVLQPILENCFEHSVRQADVLSVSITAFRDQEGTIIIEVEDNGGGIQPEQLEKLRAQMAQTEEEAAGHRGIGLYNVHRKLRLLCGKGSGLLLDSVPGKGAKVTLCIQSNVKK